VKFCYILSVSGKVFICLLLILLIMGFVNKLFVLTLVCLVLSSLLVLSVKPVEVYAVYKPSVPQFTVKLVDHSYDVPSYTTTTVDPYTGKETTTTSPGYHVENKTIELAIKNQAFKPYTENGVEYDLRYNVQSKGHFTEDWQNMGEVVPSDTQYTIRSYPASYVAGAQIDFRVEALIGHMEYDGEHWFLPAYFVSDVSSGWTVQTFTMLGESSTAPPSQSVIQPENPSTMPDDNQSQIPAFVFNPFFLLIVGVLFVGVVIVVVSVLIRHHLKTLDFGDNFSS